MQLAQIVEALLFLSRAEADAGLPGVEPIELHGWVAEHLAGRPAAGGEPRSSTVPAGRSPCGSGPIPRCWASCSTTCWTTPSSTAGAGRRSSSRRSGSARRPSWPSRIAARGSRRRTCPHVFEPFYRSAQARRRGVAGVGLGLAVVRRIATACGGSVAVRSEPGAGARFEVRFPLMPTPVEARSPPRSTDARRPG